MRLFTEWLERNDVRLLMLQRQGLEKYVSGLIKRDKSFPRHCEAGDGDCVARINDAKLEVDVDDLLERGVGREATRWRDFRAWAEASGRPFLCVQFDDMRRDVAGTMRKIFKFLRVAPKQTHSALEKSIKRPVHELISNFDDVAKALERTPWRDDPALRAGVDAAYRRTIPGRIAALFDFS